MKKIFFTLLMLSFICFQKVSNAQCCGNSGGREDMFRNGGMYFGYSTSKLTEASSDIEDNMALFNSLHPEYYKPYTFNKSGRGLHAGLYYYMDKKRRSFVNLGLTTKRYISEAEGDSSGYVVQRNLKCRQETFDLGFAYLPAKFLRVGLELNTGIYGVFKKSAVKENIKEAKYGKYYFDNGFLFGVTPSLSLRIKAGFASFYITPYYQWTPKVVTHYDVNSDGTIDQNDKRYENNLSNYGINFSMYLFVGGFGEK